MKNDNDILKVLNIICGSDKRPRTRRLDFKKELGQPSRLLLRWIFEAYGFTTDFISKTIHVPINRVRSWLSESKKKQRRINPTHWLQLKTICFLKLFYEDFYKGILSNPSAEAVRTFVLENIKDDEEGLLDIINPAVLLDAVDFHKHKALFFD